MRVVAFNSSPCPSGNIEVLLDGALRLLREAGHNIRVYNLYDLNIKPCQDCGGCVKTGVCVHDDAWWTFPQKSGRQRESFSPPRFFSST